MPNFRLFRLLDCYTLSCLLATGLPSPPPTPVLVHNLTACTAAPSSLRSSFSRISFTRSSSSIIRLSQPCPQLSAAACVHLPPSLRTLVQPPYPSMCHSHTLQKPRDTRWILHAGLPAPEVDLPEWFLVGSGMRTRAALKHTLVHLVGSCLRSHSPLSRPHAASCAHAYLPRLLYPTSRSRPPASESRSATVTRVPCVRVRLVSLRVFALRIVLPFDPARPLHFFPPLSPRSIMKRNLRNVVTI